MDTEAHPATPSWFKVCATPRFRLHSVMDAVEQLDEYKAALLYGSASLGLTGSILVRAGEERVGFHSVGMWCSPAAAMEV